jgi:hypothetical protein
LVCSFSKPYHSLHDAGHHPENMQMINLRLFQSPYITLLCKAGTPPFKKGRLVGIFNQSHLILGYFNNLFMFCQCKVRLFKEALGKVIGITLLIENFPDAGVDKHFKADAAGQGGTKKRRIVYADAGKSRLDNCILLCMQTAAQFMPLS